MIWRRDADALAHQGPAVPLDQIQIGIHLVGPIHRDVDLHLETDQRDAELPRERRRGLGHGHTTHAEAVAHAGGERPHERRCGPARAEPHGGVVLDEPEGPARESTERFRCVELHAFRTHNTIPELPPASQRPAASACQARSVSPTDHAWATQPRGVKGGSPSKISATEPTP